MATYDNIKKIKIGDNIFNLYDSGNSGGTVTKVTAGTGLSIGSTAGGNFTTTGTINHTNSVTAQTTQAVYPIKIDAQGHISAYGSAVTIPSYGVAGSSLGLVKIWKRWSGTASGPSSVSSSGNVTVNSSSTTTGRYYGVENDSKGYLFVNVPWEADTNTTYALSGALSSHKFTSTLTAGGSGSGTSTSDFTLAAGTGITITDDTSNRKMTIACSVTNTDENVKSTAGGASTDAFYLTGSSSSSTATGTLIKHAEIYAGHNPSGAYISLGGSSSNYRGWIQLYSSGASYYAVLQPADNLTANRTLTLPNETGTLLTGAFGYTTSGNNRAVQKDSSGNLYVTQKDTNTYVTQTANTSAVWRKVLGTYNSGSDPTATITSGSSNIAYYDADGPAFSTSTGELYTKGYLMYLTSSDTLYTAINNLGWVSDVMV